MRRLLEEIDAEEFAQWRAYWDVEPWRDYAGITPALLFNAHRGKKQPASADDFILRPRPPEKSEVRQTPDQMLGLVRSVHERMSRKRGRRGGEPRSSQSNP